METVIRPWGRFEVLFQYKDWIVKKIIVNPGARLSLQYHHHRKETWFVISGRGLALVEDERIKLKAGIRVEIPKKSVHRLSNKGLNSLQVIEIANGKIDEEDIVRLQDDYGRTK